MRLSQHFAEKRIALGLKPSQLAQLAGCQNVLKNGSRIRQFELGGQISKELLTKIASVLEVGQDTIEKLIEEDRREFYEGWRRWVEEPIQPYLVIRLMAAVYSRLALPSEITTMDEAEEWASSVARHEKLRCCLVWSRRISCWFDQDGTLTGKTEAVPGESNVPWMKIGGKTFTFGSDLGSVSQVDWPRQSTG